MEMKYKEKRTAQERVETKEPSPEWDVVAYQQDWATWAGPSEKKPPLGDGPCLALLHAHGNGPVTTFKV